ncbi:MAG TPA: META domain-containing protein, partial [Methanoregula sp.]|nr:META domain-containing protein [Methanoregula sp.]
MSQPIMSSRIPFLSILAGMLILVPMIVVAGCIGNAPTTGSVAVDGTKWTLTGYLFNGTLVPPQNSTMLTLEFGEDNKISGSAGCNHYFASYEMNNNKITIGQAGST